METADEVGTLVIGHGIPEEDVERFGHSGVKWVDEKGFLETLLDSANRLDGDETLTEGVTAQSNDKNLVRVVPRTELCY